MKKHKKIEAELSFVSQFPFLFLLKFKQIYRRSFLAHPGPYTTRKITSNHDKGTGHQSVE
jgi:hypothetical protein